MNALIMLLLFIGVFLVIQGTFEERLRTITTTPLQNRESSVEMFNPNGPTEPSPYY
jgi:hypothetical protein